MRDFDPPQGFRQAERLSGTLAAFRQCGEWRRQGYRERRFAERKLTFAGPERKPAPDPMRSLLSHWSMVVRVTLTSFTSIRASDLLELTLLSLSCRCRLEWRGPSGHDEAQTAVEN